MCEIAEELISKGKAEGIALGKAEGITLGKIEGRTEAIAENKESVILMLEKDFGLSHEEAVRKANETIKTVS